MDDNDDKNDNIVFIDNILYNDTIIEINTIRKDSICECPICFLEITDINCIDLNSDKEIIKTPCCNKDIHISCIYKCLLIKNTCPFCRSLYNSKTSLNKKVIFNYKDFIIDYSDNIIIDNISEKKLSKKFIIVVMCLLLLFGSAYIFLFLYPIMYYKN